MAVPRCIKPLSVKGSPTVTETSDGDVTRELEDEWWRWVDATLCFNGFLMVMTSQWGFISICQSGWNGFLSNEADVWGLKQSPDWFALPSFLMFATISLCFEGCFANIYLFHIFPSPSALMCVQLLLLLLLVGWMLKPSLNSNHKPTVKALSLAWGGR